jgi:hypothetical protein
MTTTTTTTTTTITMNNFGDEDGDGDGEDVDLTIRANARVDDELKVREGRARSPVCVYKRTHLRRPTLALDVEFAVGRTARVQRPHVHRSLAGSGAQEGGVWAVVFARTRARTTTLTTKRR